MKKLSKVVAIILSVVMVLACFAGCGEEKGPELKDVRIAYHANISGVALCAVADANGYFEEEGINAIFTKVESGPSEMAAMRAEKRTLDIGYIGAGVAWNALDGTGNELKFVFFNGLGDGESLIAREGQFTDANADGFYDFDEIYEGLKGKTVYLDTSTTPGGWMKLLIKNVNEGRPENEQLWIYSETSNYVDGYQAPNSDPAYKVNCVHIANSSVGAAISTTSADRVDIAVCFEPVPTTILASSKDIVRIAKTSTHFPATDCQPETFVASVEWMNEDPEAVQGVVNALAKAADKRLKDLNATTLQSEELSQAQAGTFDPTVAYWPTPAEYKEWFGSADGAGFGYMKALYNMASPNCTDQNNIKAFDDCYDFSYMMKAFA